MGTVVGQRRRNRSRGYTWADLSVGAARQRKGYSRPLLRAAFDLELAPETTDTFADVKKTNRLRASSLIVKRVRIETRTVIGDNYADFVGPPMLHCDVHGAAASMLRRIQQQLAHGS